MTGDWHAQAPITNHQPPINHHQTPVKAINPSAHISFPLDSFLQRLELNGFYVSPATRLRLLRVLEIAGSAFLKNPGKAHEIKYLLCPVVAQGKAEQGRFYDLFDKYWEEIHSEWVLPPLPPRPRLPDWVRSVVLAMVFGAMGLAAVIYFWDIRTPFQAYFDHETGVHEGDSIAFFNRSKLRDSADTKVTWKIFDAETKRLDSTVENSFHLKIPGDRKGGGTDKIVRLTLKDSHRQDSFESRFVVRCQLAEMPRIDSIIAPATAEVGKPVHFQAVVSDAYGNPLEVGAPDFLPLNTQLGLHPFLVGSLALTWSFDDGGLSGIPFKETTRVFERAGVFTVRLTAYRYGVDSCEVSRTHLIAIGKDTLPILAAKPLLYDQVKPTARYAWLTWTLLALLALTCGWLWRRWFSTQKLPKPDESKPEPEPEPEPQPEPEPAPTPPTPDGEQMPPPPSIPEFDKAPYSIPFQSQAANVRIERPLYRLADVFRMRQEGLRQELDLPASLAATIKEGGFPRLKTSVATVPTDYLFLVEEPSPGSHSAKLFRFVMDFFVKQREVLGEVFYFSGEPNRFRNDQFPEGILPEQLLRQHDDCRLVVISDGHAWLDGDAPFRPVPVAAPVDFLRPAVVEFFKNWQRRLLLTPVPMAEWTYREGALHDLFDLFPADSEGLGEASKNVERQIADDEHRPGFAAWRERLQNALRLKPLTSNLLPQKRWNTAEEHRRNLQNEPLYQWLRRLALYPKPDWNLTIAIGKAIGADVSYDNLLALSRVPWLQSGEPPQRVRKELLASLTRAETEAAHQAIVRELSAVAEAVKGSFAGRLREVQLAVNAFALQPDDPGAKAEIRRLQEAKRLTPRDLWDVSASYERYVLHREQLVEAEDLDGSMPAPAPDLPPSFQEFLADETPPPAPPASPEIGTGSEREQTPPPPKPPFFNAHFYRAASATLAFFALFGFCWATDGADWLFKTYFKKEPVAAVEYAENLPEGDALVRVQVEAEEAVLHNNNGVNAFREVFGLNETDVRKAVVFNASAQNRIFSHFRQAIEASKDKSYPLAEDNITKTYFNAGVDKYNLYLQESRDTNLLHEASANFSLATLPPTMDSIPFPKIEIGSGPFAWKYLQLDAVHGLGLAQFYLERRDSAEALYNLLLERTDSQYFDTLDMVPNLETLLFSGPPEPTKPGVEIRTISVQVLDEESGAPLSNVRVTSTAARFAGRTDRNGRVSVFVEEGKRQRFEFKREDYFTYRQQISSRRTPLTIRLKINPYEYPPKPDFEPLVGNAGRARVFGSFTYKSAGDGTDNVIVTDDWVEKNIVQVEIPQLKGLPGFPSSGKIRFHRLAAKQLQAAFAEIERAGLLNRVLHWHGSYVPRYVSESRKVLSIQSWGSAFDINAEWNGLGRVPALKGEKGSVRELVQIFNKHGFYWGGHFSRMDGMHFEVAVLTQDPVPVQSTVEEEKPPVPEPDRDGDGVPDAQDDCDDEVGTLENNGCPVQIPPPPPTAFVEPEMIPVPGGTFTMGCNEKLDKDCEDDEKPPHQVTVSDFFIGKYEVTNEQYAVFLNDYGSTAVKDGEYKGEKMIEEYRGIEFPTENVTTQSGFRTGFFKPQKDYEKYPVVRISWFGANEYCRWLSKKTGKNYRLPTEAEWEYAAKGGRDQQPFIYSGSNNLDSIAWYSGNSDKIQPVGRKNANRLGAFDMSGNVWEWCNDWYDEKYYKQSGVKDPVGPAKGKIRVSRGGSWNMEPKDIRITNRLRVNLSTNIGAFRLAQGNNN